MRPVVRFSIKQKVLINVIFIILVIGGAFSIYQIPVENMPTVDIGKVFIYTTWYGASAEDVETLVTAKIEEALDDLEHVEFIQSYSYRNFSTVQVKFIDDTDYRDLYDELRFRVQSARKELPPGVEDSTYLYIDTHFWKPVIMVNITGDIPQRSLKLYADELKSMILGIPNVRNATISGEFDREFHVSLDPAKLRKYGITFGQVSDAVKSANTKIPAGRFRTNASEFMLDSGKRLDSQQAVLSVVVRKDGDGNFIRVEDLVTSAGMSHRDPFVIPSVNGENTLRLIVVKEESGNSVTIAEQVRNLAREFEKTHKGDGIGIVFTNDSTIEIDDSVNTLGGNLLLGLSLVIGILWVTIGFRNALLTAVGIPFAFLCSLTIMYVGGTSLNTISLFSFVLVTGIMVDDAVIIMENVYRHIQMGKPKIEAVVDGTGEVMIPVISSALTTIFAFLPMLIMTGSTGEFFAEIPKTVTYALCASLFEALLILPIHILDWGPKSEEDKFVDENENPFHHIQSGVFAPFWKIYRFLLERLLNHKAIVLFAVFILFLGSIGVVVVSALGIIPLIKVEFFPGNYFRYHVNIELPVGTPIETTDETVRDISRFILSLGPKQADSSSGTAGYFQNEDYTLSRGGNHGEIIVTLPPEKIRDFPENPKNDPMQHLEHMKQTIRSYISNKYPDPESAPKIKIFAEQDGPPKGKAVNIRVTGLTMDIALDTSKTLMDFMKKSPELADLQDIDDNRPDFKNTVKFHARQEACFEYGISPGSVIGLTATALNGAYAGKFRSVDEEVDLMIRLARTEDPVNPKKRGLSTPENVLDVPIVEHSTAPIRIRDLVDVSYSREPSIRTRYKGRPSITISADIKPGSKLSPARVKNQVEKFFNLHPELFTNVTLSFGGEFETTTRSYTSLFFAFFIALLLIYMVLASQFNDYFQPVIIISAIPFALIGVVVGLFVTRTTFTIGSFMAVVGLAGVAVNDSLLMIEFMNIRKLTGRPIRDVVIEASAVRMRPVLITTITTILGLLPMAIGFPHKSISWSPMATAFVSGLSSATLLTLLIIPLEYETFEKFRAFLGRIRRKKTKTENENSENRSM